MKEDKKIACEDILELIKAYIELYREGKKGASKTITLIETVVDWYLERMKRRMKGDKISRDLNRIKEIYRILCDISRRCIAEYWGKVYDLRDEIEDKWLREIVDDAIMVWSNSHNLACDIIYDLIRYLEKKCQDNTH